MKEATSEDVGSSVVFFDPLGRATPALVTAVWGDRCVNVAYVNQDDDQKDTFGRKIARSTSVMHGSVQQAHGNYWLWPGESR